MNLSMPPTFFQDVFQEFARFAGNLFPEIFSDGNLRDPFQKRELFQSAWLAVYYTAQLHKVPRGSSGKGVEDRVAAGL